MSQIVEKPSVFPVSRDSFPKTTAFFDWGHYVIQRTEGFLWESKRLLFGTGFMLFLIYELAHFAKHLLDTWSG
jgi:hypothetical protein